MALAQYQCVPRHPTPPAPLWGAGRSSVVCQGVVILVVSLDCREGGPLGSVEPQEKGRVHVLPRSQAHPVRLVDTGLCSMVLLLAAKATLSMALGWTRFCTRQRAQLLELQMNLCLCCSLCEGFCQLIMH